MPRPDDAWDAIDQSNNKFKNKLGMGAIPDRFDERDYDYRVVAAAGLVKALPDSISLASLLPKETWQQDDMAACTAFAAQLLIAAARAKDKLPYQRPSWMATWFWAKQALFGQGVAGKNIGCSIREAVLSTKREGVAWESEWPYTKDCMSGPPNDNVVIDAQNYQSLYFFRVDDFETGIEVDFLYRCLAEGWPISVALPIYNTFEPDYSTSMIPYPKEKDKLQGHHAMVIYGYFLRGGSPYFKVRNSWGVWGGRHTLPSGREVEPGTCHIPVEYIRDLGYDCWSIRAVEDGKVQGVPIEEVIPIGH